MLLTFHCVQEEDEDDSEKDESEGEQRSGFFIIPNL